MYFDELWGAHSEYHCQNMTMSYPSHTTLASKLWPGWCVSTDRAIVCYVLISHLMPCSWLHPFSLQDHPNWLDIITLPEKVGWSWWWELIGHTDDNIWIGVVNVYVPTTVLFSYPDSKVHGTIMGPIWGRQDPDGPHVGHMNFAIWVFPKLWSNEEFFMLKNM